MALNEEQYVKFLEEMEKRQADTGTILHRINLDQKNKFHDFYRYIHLQNKELQEIEEYDDRIATTALKEAEIARDENLANEMRKLKLKEANEQRMLQVLRTTSPELKELEAKLKAAYNNKALSAQIQERQAENMMDRIREREVREKLNQARMHEAEFRQKMKERSIEAKNKYKLELQDQMIFQERQRRTHYEEFLQEKKFIDDLVQRIQEEDDRERQSKHCQMLETQKEMEAFHEAQHVWRARERNQMEEEDRKIKEFIKEKAELQRKLKQDTAEKEAAKAKIIDDMSKEIYQQKRKEEEKAEIISELLEEEKKALYDKELRDNALKKERNKIEVLSSLQRQMQERQAQIKQQQLEDAAYKEELIAKIAEENRIEQLTKEKKRLKMLQIRKDVEQMLLDRRQRKAEEMQQQLILEEIRKKEDDEKKKFIEAERVALLQRHVKNVIGFLPRGTLKPGDLELLGKDLHSNVKYSQNDEVRMAGGPKTEVDNRNLHGGDAKHVQFDKVKYGGGGETPSARNAS